MYFPEVLESVHKQGLLDSLWILSLSRLPSGICIVRFPSGSAGLWERTLVHQGCWNTPAPLEIWMRSGLGLLKSLGAQGLPKRQPDRRIWRIQVPRCDKFYEILLERRSTQKMRHFRFLRWTHSKFLGSAYKKGRRILTPIVVSTGITRTILVHRPPWSTGKSNRGVF